MPSNKYTCVSCIKKILSLLLSLEEVEKILFSKISIIQKLKSGGLCNLDI